MKILPDEIKRFGGESVIDFFIILIVKSNYGQIDHQLFKRTAINAYDKGGSTWHIFNILQSAARALLGQTEKIWVDMNTIFDMKSR